MNIACVILNYNDAERSLKLASEIEKYKNISHVILVDNLSTDGSYRKLKNSETNKIHCVKTNYNGGYGYGNNYGLNFAFNQYNADLAIIANPDVFFSEELVEKLVVTFQCEKDAGVVSAIQLDVEGREVIGSAWSLPNKWTYIMSIEYIASRFIKTFYNSLAEIRKAPYVQVDCVAGALLMISKNAYLDTGGYDEDVFLYCEETILGYRLKTMGYKTFIRSDVKYNHIHGATIGKNISSAVKQKKMINKSHHLVLKRYMKANKIELLVDRLLAGISIAEVALRKCTCSKHIS